MILALNAESFVGCSLGEATAALASAAASASPANLLAVSPAEEAAARRVMSLPRPDKKGKRTAAVSREINCDLEDIYLDPPEPYSSGASAFEDFTVELEKTPGRGLGISVVGRRDGPGVFVSDMVGIEWLIWIRCHFVHEIEMDLKISLIELQIIGNCNKVLNARNQISQIQCHCATQRLLNIKGWDQMITI